MLAVLFAIIGPRWSYGLMGWSARLLYRLLEPLRLRSEAQCRAALGSAVPDADTAGIAEQSFVHRAQNLTDLMLASRLLRRDSHQRHGGQLTEPYLTQLLDAQQRGQPVILVTAYYGAFDLLPIFLGYNGLRACIVYRPHDNPRFDAYRRRIRGQSGCELVSIADAPTRLAEVLGAGGTVGLVGDHHAEERGMPAEFMGQKTKVLRSIGLLAWRYSADVVVAGIRRLDNTFRFELEVTDVVRHDEWEGHDDPVAFVTDRYLRALERLILADPTQYLWGYARWGEQFAQQATARHQTPQDPAARRPSTVTGGVGDGESQAD